MFELRIEETNKPLEITAGEVAGLVKSRDDVLGDFLDTLDDFASTLAFEFNRLFSSGQGLKVINRSPANGRRWYGPVLDAPGLPFTPINGSFQVQVYNKRHELTETTDIRVDLNGLDSDTTLADLAAAIDAVDGVSASINGDNRLMITSDSADRVCLRQRHQRRACGAGDQHVLLRQRRPHVGREQRTWPPTRSSSPPAAEASAKTTQMAVELAAFHGEPLDSQDGLKLSEVYDRMTADVTQSSTVAQRRRRGARVRRPVEGQSLAISGVNIDEEVIKMIRYQRSFQASAKYIATLDELLESWSHC